MSMLLEGTFHTEKLKEIGASVRAPAEADAEIRAQGSQFIWEVVLGSTVGQWRVELEEESTTQASTVGAWISVPQGALGGIGTTCVRM